MFCMHCGQALPTDAAFCPNCGKKVETASNNAPPAEAAVSSAPPASQKDEEAREINSYMGFAIVMAVLGCLCCTPLTLVPGIVAVVFASQVPGFVRSGHCEIAIRKALFARIFCWITFGILALHLFGIVMLIRYSEEISDFLTERIYQERADGENGEQAEPDPRHNDYSLLWELLD